MSMQDQLNHDSRDKNERAYDDRKVSAGCVLQQSASGAQPMALMQAPHHAEH